MHGTYHCHALREHRAAGNARRRGWVGGKGITTRIKLAESRSSTPQSCFRLSRGLQLRERDLHGDVGVIHVPLRAMRAYNGC